MSHILAWPYCAIFRRDQAASQMIMFVLMPNLLSSLFRCCPKAYCEQAVPSCQGAFHSTPDSCRAGKPECTAKQEEEAAPCAVCRYKASVKHTCSINKTYTVSGTIQAAQTRGALHDSQSSMSSLLSHTYVMQHTGRARAQTVHLSRSNLNVIHLPQFRFLSSAFSSICR